MLDDKEKKTQIERRVKKKKKNEERFTESLQN